MSTNYFLYVDGGGTKDVPAYFSYKLYENDKPAGPIVWKEGQFTYEETIACNRMLSSKIPLNELPPNCSTVDHNGNESNNLAEYQSLYYALKHVYDISGHMPLTVYQDSQLVVNQVNGLWACKKPWLIPWRDAIVWLKWSSVLIEWTPRKNIVAILGH